MNHHLARLAYSDTFGTNAWYLFQRQMHDATLPRGHGIQAKWLLRGLHALRGNPRGHAQLFKPQSAVTATIEMNLFVERGLEPQRAKRQMLQRFQKFGSTLEE